jgi:hypothetical protein
MKGVLSDAIVHLHGEIIIRQDNLEELELENLKLTENKNQLENKIKRNEEIYKKERQTIEINSSQSEQQINELETQLLELKNLTSEENLISLITQQILDLKQTILLKRSQHLKKKQELNENIVQSVTMLAEYKEKMKQRLGEIKELMEQKLQQTLSIEINEMDGVLVHKEIPFQKMSLLQHQLLTSTKKIRNTLERSGAHSLPLPRGESPIEVSFLCFSLNLF